MNWYKKAQQKELEKYFFARLKKHINMVQKSAKKIAQLYPEFSDLIEKVKTHDQSKFEEPELTPYISLTWRKKPGNKDTKGLLSLDEENKATIHHVTSNSHHPEYHLENKEEANIDPKDRDKSIKCIDASAMPNIDIAEMVADWQAVSEELQTNTAREWFNKQKDVRWKFSPKQEKLIDKLLMAFE